MHLCVHPGLIAAALGPDEANAGGEHGGGSEAAWYCLSLLLIPGPWHQLTCHDHTQFLLQSKTTCVFDCGHGEIVGQVLDDWYLQD